MNGIYRLAIFFFLWIAVFSLSAQDWQVALDSVPTLSSPKALDCNNDDVLDVILGVGYETSMYNGVFALDGSSGETIWFAPVGNEIYGAAIFLDVNNDDQKDIIINGRTGNLLALDGLTGDRIWNLLDDVGLPVNDRDGFYHNVFTPCIIDDVDGDDTEDLLITYGGGGVFALDDTVQHAYLAVINGADGSIIWLLPLPTASQAYMAPVLLTVEGQTDIIVGTGGEKHGGQLFRIPLSSVVGGTLTGLLTIEENPFKGFIQSPVLADINGDGIKDILASNLSESIYAIDGSDNSRLWWAAVDGYELYAGMTPGYFNDDDVVDLSILVGFGSWPYYPSFRRYIIDGRTGIRTRIDEKSAYLDISSGASYWSDDDPDRSQLIYMRNTYTAALRLLEVMRYKNGSLELMIAMEDQTILGGAPLIEDLDNDGVLDLIIAASDYAGGFGNTANKTIVTRISLEEGGGSQWNGFMGNKTNGCWEADAVTGITSNDHAGGIDVYPNPFIDRIYANVSQIILNYPSEKYILKIFSAHGRLVSQQLFTTRDGPVISVFADRLKQNGMYLMTIGNDGGELYSNIILKQSH